MYKIFIKFDTTNPTYNLYDCYMEENEYGDIVEYETSDLSEIENKVKELLKKYTSDRIHIFSTTEVEFGVTVTDPDNVSDPIIPDTPSDTPSDEQTDTTTDNTTGNPEDNENVDNTDNTEDTPVDESGSE